MSYESSILLESGTGEVEILEFIVENKHYAINVIKTKEIFSVDRITQIPNADPSIAGMTLIRGKTITLIDLTYVLEKKTKSKERRMALFCEFNQTQVAFLVDEVVGIHRIGWEKIEKPDGLVSDSLVIGNIPMDEKILMLLDFEKIFVDLGSYSPYGEYEKSVEKINYNKNRSNAKIVLADDSKTIRALLKEVLTNAGYKHLTFFDNGKQLLEYLEDISKNQDVTSCVDAVITDIEMPQMDGHTLTRKIKENTQLSKLPVIIFSSLITNELRHKGESVGADAQMSKPEVDNLVKLIDQYIV